ncbi:MAG: CPBP family intramembrane metalloprotease [Anaerolineae bacterium]|nr:CPBP family intramembrane metalloprotease [Anaerolineae bacterium]
MDLLPLMLIGFIGVVIYGANQAKIGLWETGVIKWMLYTIIAGVFFAGFGMFQLMIIYSNEIPPQLADLPRVNVFEAGFTMIAAFVFTAIGLSVINSTTARLTVQRVIGQSFDPISIVHITALILIIGVIIGTFSSYVLLGGQSGIADNLETAGISPIEPIFTAVVQVAAAFLGIGFAIRRDLNESLSRLGLRWPNRADLINGGLTGLGMIVLSFVFQMVWAALTPPEQFAQQTEAAEALTRLLATIPLTLIISVCAAVGEEILLRGAIQPIFGIYLTSVVFALLHSQYFLSPSLILLFILSLILGRLRERYSTTAAIFAHFIYNLIPLLLIILAGNGNAL